MLTITVFRFCFVFFMVMKGSSNVIANGVSSRNITANSLHQQSGSTREQSNSNTTASSNAINITLSNDSSNSKSSIIIPVVNQKQFTDMPVEIFDKIFSYTGYKEVSNMRLVKNLWIYLIISYFLTIAHLKYFFDLKSRVAL